MQKIETIFSPALFELYRDGINNKNVVVIDILRATTTICVAFGNGVKEMVAVSSPEEAMAMKDGGYLVAAERGGKTVEGFELGNSPQDFTSDRVKNKKIAITTTNGTKALNLAKNGKNVYIGCFLNLNSLAEILMKQDNDVILFCSGWNDKFNLEDTLFAGALATRLKSKFNPLGDATFAAMDLYNIASVNLSDYLQKASHVQRFKSLHVESDLEICLQMNVSDIVPVFKNGIINRVNNAEISI